MVEDGGYAATALRKAYGRKLTRYDHYTSRGRKAHQVCVQHQMPQPCLRCSTIARRAADVQAPPREPCRHGNTHGQCEHCLDAL